MGRFSVQVRHQSSSYWSDFWHYLAYKLTLFRVRRRLAVLFCTLGATYLGYTLAGYGQNLYTMGYMPRISQCTDFSTYYVYGLGSNQRKKYLL